MLKYAIKVIITTYFVICSKSVIKQKTVVDLGKANCFKIVAYLGEKIEVNYGSKLQHLCKSMGINMTFYKSDAISSLVVLAAADENT